MDVINDYQANYGSGWIKLFRSLQDKGWYKKSDYVHLWIHILIRSNHKEKEIMFGGENIKLKPGQFITGRKSLSQEVGINESKIERILKFFEKSEQQIEQQKSNKNRIITVVSWSQYQQSEQQSEQQVNNNRTTSEQQVNTDKNIKKYKTEKKKKENRKEIFIPPSLNDVIQYFKLKGYKIETAKKAFDYYDASNWVDSNGKSVRNWKQKMISVWFKDENKMNNIGSNGRPKLAI